MCSKRSGDGLPDDEHGAGDTGDGPPSAEGRPEACAPVSGAGAGGGHGERPEDGDDGADGDAGAGDGADGDAGAGDGDDGDDGAGDGDAGKPGPGLAARLRGSRVRLAVLALIAASGLVAAALGLGGLRRGPQPDAPSAPARPLLLGSEEALGGDPPDADALGGDSATSLGGDAPDADALGGDSATSLGGDASGGTEPVGAGDLVHSHSHAHDGGPPHTHSHTHPHIHEHEHEHADEAAAGSVAEASPGTWTVTYTSQGEFEPERLDVATGDTVEFVNESQDPVWPASNIHPTHDILPEFDPLEVVWPGESWSHTFTRNGFWRYHNHLDASQSGLIVALGGAEEEMAPLAANMEPIDFPPAPSSVDGAELFDEEALGRFVETYGPANAVAALKAVELRTGRACHDAAHLAGRTAYELFGPIAFSVSGHECQAGAMHGVIEALFAERGTSRLTEDLGHLCSNTLNPFVRHQCYHGVGHGLMAWTTYEIHDALDYCDTIDNGADAASCYSGVFMENVVGGLSGAMGHETLYLSQDDPHFPCDIVEDRHRPHCYFFQTSHMVTVFGGDMARVAAACAELRGEARRLCFASYGRDVGNLTRGRPAEGIELCGHAPAGADRVECVAGAVQDRFWETTGADEAVEMCSMLDESREADTCWWTIIDRAGDVFPDEEGRRSFCHRVPADRRGLCEREILP